MKKEIIIDIIDSWENKIGNINTTGELLNWIKELNTNTSVHIEECSILDSSFWFYDDYNGEILNRKRSFFSITGMRRFQNNKFILEQPIIMQPEIGYLGIICKKIDGVLNFLMQAKIEPGNVNCVQLSPTIQATKSNFTRSHGGKLPYYFEYFENSKKYYVIYDQLQSEQATRFYKKRNRNMIMLVEDYVEVFPNFRWMTLGQIKELMKIDNLVNMDTRTVLSGLPLIGWGESIGKFIKEKFVDKELFHSIFSTNPLSTIVPLYKYINNYKMFNDIKSVVVPLNQLVDWEINEYGITSRKYSSFMVRYYDISIDGREVVKWKQPLFKAIGMATFGLITTVIDDVKKYLVKIRSELGAFDKVEVGPSIQWEPTHYLYDDDIIDNIFRKYVECKRNIIIDVVLSEEGGRFYHEQNRNVIVQVEYENLVNLPDGYFLVDYSCLNYLIQINNCCNIQLRNLVSLIDI